MNNRIIKFRAWDKDDKKMMCLGEALKNELLGIDEQDYYLRSEYDSVILMQFTGLKDKNEKEIYEGDIIKDHRRDSLFEVVYYEDGVRFDGKDLTGKHYGVTFGENFYIKVIGNVWENGDLIK
jgi:uncharacterized phage protein (TIGR01671 family)